MDEEGRMARPEAAQHSSRRRISVCVDDFGLHAGINEAVEALVVRGRVQAVSAMVGGPAWREGAARLRALGPSTVEVGLHLDVTECPLQHGVRRPLSQWIARSYLGLVDAAMLGEEIRRQWDAFEQALGRAPDYIDGHQHVHQLPVLRRLLMEELARRDPQRRVWLRATRCAPRAAHADARTFAKAQVIANLGSRALATLARRGGWRQNRALLGVYDFAGGEAGYRQRLPRWLQAAQDGDLLMCHAGRPGAAFDGLAAARAAEACVIAGPQWDEWLAAAGVSLQPMGAILAPVRAVR